jgi:hypothetical protein
MLGKTIIISYTEVRDKFEMFRSRCSETERTAEMKSIEKKQNKEKICNLSLYGIKSKSVIKIIPNNKKTPGISIDPKCKKKVK